ncbi:DUF4760 domain-containing protein [Maricaulis salignorans]|nr:hypothetical protein [Maricaulis salignorans]
MTFELSGRAMAAITGYTALISGVILLVLFLLFCGESTGMTLQTWQAVMAAALVLPFAIAVATVWIDLTASDHQTAYHFRTAEKPISLQLRLLRNLILIAYPQTIVLGFAIVDLIRHAALNTSNLGPIFILISAIMASAGWLYTNYVNALKTRHVAAIEHLSHINSNERHRNYASALKAFIAEQHHEGVDGIGDLTFSLAAVKDLWENAPTVIVEGKEYTFREVCRYFLGYLEHVAISIRVGIFDFDIIQRQRRRRLMLYFNTLFYVIIYQSAATENPPHRRGKNHYRRGNDMWENFIWLIMRMDDKSRINSDLHPYRRIDPRRLRKPTEPTPQPASGFKYGGLAEIDDA